MLNEDLIIQLENLAVTLVSQSQYIGEMMKYHPLANLYGLSPVQIVRTDKIMNYKDPDSETGFTVMAPLVGLLHPYTCANIIDEIQARSSGGFRHIEELSKTKLNNDVDAVNVMTDQDRVIYEDNSLDYIESPQQLPEIPSFVTEESTRDIESFMAHYLYNPLIIFNHALLSEIPIYEMDDVTTIFENFLRSTLHEFRHVVQFYEICRQMGSVPLGFDMYQRIIDYSNKTYPWPFTPLEKDALSVMYSIDPFKDYYDGALRDMITNLIDEVIDSEE